jgi:hypothetical protein
MFNFWNYYNNFVEVFYYELLMHLLEHFNCGLFQFNIISSLHET